MCQKNSKDSISVFFGSQAKDKLQGKLLTSNKNLHSPSLRNKDIDILTTLKSKSSAYRLSEQSSNQQKNSNYSEPFLTYKLSSDKSSSNDFNKQICRLQQEKNILQKNFIYQVQYYIRERMRDLVTLQELLQANQYQRAQKYIEKQIALMKKRHEIFSSEDTCCKPTLTRDISIGSNIQQDVIYTQLVTNIVNNLKQIQLGNNFLLPIIKKLSNQPQLSTKKLAWYFEQVPFQITSQHSRTNLAIKFVSQLGYRNGRKILQTIAKSVEQNTSGKYILKIQQEPTKSEMSRLIQQHSISKIKKKIKQRESMGQISV